MRKNLHYKVLASVLAIAGLYFYNAPAAWAKMQNITEQTTWWIGTGTINNNNNEQIQTGDSVYGWHAQYPVYGDSTKKANNNKITISGSELSNVCGGVEVEYNETANSNEITINNSNIDYITGGSSYNGTASGNKVLIEGNKNSFVTVTGGYTASGEATGNIVTIKGNVTASFIAGGVGEREGSGKVYGNKVIVESGNVTGLICGGRGSNGSISSIYNNDITIKGSANVQGANLWGAYFGTTISNNTLTLDGWQNNQNNTVASLNNFSDIYINNFTLNTNLINVGSVSGMKDVTIHLGAFTGDIALTAGDYAVGYNVKAAEIKWDSKLGSNIDFTTKDESGNDVQAFDQSLAKYNKFYIANRTGDGVYATKFNNTATSGENSVSITAEVEKSILADKFIDENGQEHTNTQTQNRILTIGDGFTTKVGTVAGAYAAKKFDGTAQDATGGTVNISGSTDWNGTVYAGYSESGAVNGNKINAAANTKAQNMSLSGYNTSGTGNELNISGNGSAFNEINNFKTINFDKVALNEAAALTVTNANVDGTTINVNSLAGGNNYKIGDSATLLKSANAITGTGNVTIANDIVTAGLIQDLNINTAQSADNTSIDLYVEDVSMNGQITLVAENRAVAAAFVNQGTDLISDSLDTLSRDGSYGVKTFAAVHGNRSKYDVNSDLKINGWSTIVGIGNAAEFADGDEFSWGVFYENGSGNYRTFNEFNNEFFRGDGSLVYNGGGIAARYENASGVYTEGSLRAGMLKSEIDNALRDGAGNYYGYDSESAYYGAHIGVGKIISLSDSSDLDVYGKFFHTYTEGDSFTVAKDKFEFDSITSDRLRIGARVTTNKANAFSTYYGLAYEYEFNGDADMRAQNLKAPTQSLQGSSYMAEVGFNYQPTPDSPWSFDLNMRGYAGEREGASFNVQATYTF